MDIDINSIIATIIQVANAFLNSGFFWFVKFILAIYVVVLFADMVLLLMVRGLGGDIRNTLMGAPMPLASKKKLQKRWMEIENRLKLGDAHQGKIAILEADKLADETLFFIGYKGGNMKERLDSADSKQIEDLESLKEAHDIRNKIIYDKNFRLDKEEVLRIINIYREFLDNLEII
ncbi:MAG: hypothetical protein ACD_7C00146G0003 [uncultured bacterium]|nr:MAG: hypothetical protein ACD_7C00146G0003 [uncultured bacterium]KKP67274.1 MAG: hypothetical protein UR66_C0018G0014 [Candidatus Moranbacteria bacterium GW2011_GWE1_35_17]KKP67302.1 MAG: hypothetical protein UR65_C0073G0013 [Candidatus Moranbacteria bacterium GW2011_GWE2_35_164]KKP80911.1 MAG: hypothetical protein UR82_C0078G0004 [Candidatus Moranbacteria bacterium GW2011_GWF1_35_5]KKP84699.1 MAG: hypothetical protein UR83_C0014G0002 [Candidatus Moranbacteria bacterium GW2011_GWF2_35_54]HB